MKKLAEQEDETERQRLRKLALGGQVPNAPQPYTLIDQTELRETARDEDEQSTALQQESIEAFHARGAAAAADLKRGGKSYAVDQVLIEMRAMTATRRRELAEGCLWSSGG